MYRVLAANQEVHERRNQLRHGWIARRLQNGSVTIPTRSGSRDAGAY